VTDELNNNNNKNNKNNILVGLIARVRLYINNISSADISSVILLSSLNHFTKY